MDEQRWTTLGAFLVGCIIGVSAGVAIGLFIHPLIFSG